MDALYRHCECTPPSVVRLILKSDLVSEIGKRRGMCPVTDKTRFLFSLACQVLTFYFDSIYELNLASFS